MIVELHLLVVVIRLEVAVYSSCACHRLHTVFVLGLSLMFTDICCFLILLQILSYSLIVYGYQLYNAVLFCLLLTAFNTLVWVSSNNLYVVYHRLVVLILYILFSIAIVACIFVPRFYSFVYDIIFTKMRRHIRQIETSYFRVYNVIFWRNGHLVG